MEHRAKLSHGRQELSAVEREIRGLVQAIKDGVSALSIKNELMALEARQAELKQHLEAPEMPQLLQPRMADVYREKVGTLCHALEHEDSRAGATNAIRGLIEAIVLEPDGGRLKIRLKGDVAGMLSAARPPSRAAGISACSGESRRSAAEAETARGRQRPTTSWSKYVDWGRPTQRGAGGAVVADQERVQMPPAPK